MEREKDLLSAEELLNASAGFMVVNDSWGRLDNLSMDEISHLGGHVERLAAEVARLQAGIDLARERQLENDRAKIREKYS